MSKGYWRVQKWNPVKETNIIIGAINKPNDCGGDDLYNETISSIKISNEYQDTGTVAIIPNVNAKRRMRTWRTHVPRDNSARIRNPYTDLEITFNNTSNNDRRIILHDVITHYTDAPM